MAPSAMTPKRRIARFAADPAMRPARSSSPGPAVSASVIVGRAIGGVYFRVMRIPGGTQRQRIMRRARSSVEPFISVAERFEDVAGAVVYETGLARAQLPRM